MIRALLVLLVACGDPVILLVGPPAGEEPVNKLLVILGQSNATDTAVAADITTYPDLEVAYPAVQIVDRNSATPADPPVFVDESARDLTPRSVQLSATFPIGTGGMACLMGRELADNTIDTWAIAKFTISGSGLTAHWNNASYPTAGTKLRAQAIAFIQAQALAFNVTDLENNLVVIWNQGETDAVDAGLYADYLAEIDDFFTTLRATLGDFRVVIQRLSTRYVVSGSCFHPQQIRAAQESWASTASKVHVIPTDDAPFRDPSHLSDDGAGAVGLRTTDVLVPILTGTTPTSPYYVASGPVVESADSASGITVPPPRHFDGDVFMVWLSALGNTNYGVPTDSAGTVYAQFPGSPQHDGGDGLNARLHAWWARADQATMDANGGQMPPALIADIGGDDNKIGGIMLFRGCATSGDPFDVTAGDTEATSTSVEIPGDETTGANRLIVALAAIRVDSGTPQFSAWANADLTDVTQQVSYSTATTVGYGMGVATGRKAVAGAYGATTATLATTSTQARLSIALKP